MSKLAFNREVPVYREAFPSVIGPDIQIKQMSIHKSSV